MGFVSELLGTVNIHVMGSRSPDPRHPPKSTCCLVAEWVDCSIPKDLNPRKWVSFSPPTPLSLRLSLAVLFSLGRGSSWEGAPKGSLLSRHHPWGSVFQLFREVRIMKVLNHPNIGENPVSFLLPSLTRPWGAGQFLTGGMSPGLSLGARE